MVTAKAKLIHLASVPYWQLAAGWPPKASVTRSVRRWTWFGNSHIC